jgi:hypothetical protein
VYVIIVFTYTCGSCLKKYNLKDKNVTQFTVLMQKGMTDKGKEDGVKDDSSLSFSRLFPLVCVY